jgi:hypothetical protein
MKAQRLAQMSSLVLVLVAGCSAAGARGAQSQAGQNTPASTGAAPAKAGATAARIEPKAQQILDRMVQALGGSAFLSFKTLTTHGRAFTLYNGASGGFVYFDSQVEYPDKRRVSYGLAKKTQPIVLINNGDSGWEIDRMGVVQQEPKDLDRWKIGNRYSLENLLRLGIRSPGVLLQTAGVDFVDNLPVDVLDMIDADQAEVKIDVNKQDGLPLEISYRSWNTATQDWDEYSDTYSDYQRFQGITTPMHISRSVNGRRVGETYRSSAVYNDVYPAGLFAAPGG